MKHSTIVYPLTFFYCTKIEIVSSFLPLLTTVKNANLCFTIAKEQTKMICIFKVQLTNKVYWLTNKDSMALIFFDSHNGWVTWS